MEERAWFFLPLMILFLCFSHDQLCKHLRLAPFSLWLCICVLVFIWVRTFKLVHRCRYYYKHRTWTVHSVVKYSLWGCVIFNVLLHVNPCPLPPSLGIIKHKTKLWNSPFSNCARRKEQSRGLARKFEFLCFCFCKLELYFVHCSMFFFVHFQENVIERPLFFVMICSG